jgi:hypothetical protein
MWLYYVIVAVIFFATFAMCIQQGLWNNTLTTINILLSGVIAFGCYQPAATFLAAIGGEGFTYLLDFLMLWALYVVAFIVLHRVFSGMLSKTRMRFKYPIDMIGGPVMAAVAAWLMAGIVGASLHAAPFEEKAFGGVFVESGRTVATNPDVMWLNIAANLLGEDSLGRSGSDFSQGKYIKDFNKQRAALEKEKGLSVKR